MTARIADATVAAGARPVFADNLDMYGLQRGGRAMAETTPTAATDHKSRVRAAMAVDLLDRAAHGDLRVAVGRASDYYGPHGTTTVLGTSFFRATLRGRAANVVGSLDTPHTRPVRLRASASAILRLLGLAVPMMRALAGVAYQWQRPFVADDSAFRAAFPEAVRVSPHRDAVAVTTAWWRDQVGRAATITV